MLDTTIKESYLTDVAIRTSHNLYSTITKKLPKYTDLKEEITRMWQLNAVCVVPLELSGAGIVLNKLPIV
jgi:hypothetical protein